jgi:DNA-binding NarL/FixJ family response regulator
MPDLMFREVKIMLKTIERTKPAPTVELYQQLSTREHEVLKLIVEGYSNAEIATVLYLSPCTIKTHIRNIMNKLGVEHRTQAAVFAVRQGIA